MSKKFKLVLAYERNEDGSFDLLEHNGFTSEGMAMEYLSKKTGVIYSDIVPYEDGVVESVDGARVLLG